MSKKEISQKIFEMFSDGHFWADIVMENIKKRFPEYSMYIKKNPPFDDRVLVVEDDKEKVEVIFAGYIDESYIGKFGGLLCGHLLIKAIISKKEEQDD